MVVPQNSKALGVTAGSEKKAFFFVDESMIAPNRVLIAVVAVDGERYRDFMSSKVSQRKESPLYRAHQAQLHHTSDSPSIRSDMAAWILNPAPISAYFLIQDVDPNFDELTAKKWAYRHAFPKVLLDKILRKQKKLYGQDYAIDIAFENLTNKPNADAQFFAECITTLNYPSVNARVITKSDPLVTLPDYMAGILRSSMANTAKNMDKTNARLVEDVIGLIAVAEKGRRIAYFSRGDEVKRFLANTAI